MEVTTLMLGSCGLCLAACAVILHHWLCHGPGIFLGTGPLKQSGVHAAQSNGHEAWVLALLSVALAMFFTAIVFYQ